jgi:hypothetical protein
MDDKAKENNLQIANALIDGFNIPFYKIEAKASILRNGWEMDNKAWLISYPEVLFAVTTSHGRFHFYEVDELKEDIQSHVEALSSLNHMLEKLNA